MTIKDRAQKEYVILTLSYKKVLCEICNTLNGRDIEDLDNNELADIELLKNDLNEIASNRRLIEQLVEMSESDIIYIDEHILTTKFIKIANYIDDVFDTLD